MTIHPVKIATHIRLYLSPTPPYLLASSQLLIMIESVFVCLHCHDIVFACSYCSAVNTPAVYFGEYLLEEGYVK